MLCCALLSLSGSLNFGNGTDVRARASYSTTVNTTQPGEARRDLSNTEPRGPRWRAGPGSLRTCARPRTGALNSLTGGSSGWSEGEDWTHLHGRRAWRGTGGSSIYGGKGPRSHVRLSPSVCDVLPHHCLNDLWPRRAERPMTRGTAEYAHLYWNVRHGVVDQLYHHIFFWNSMCYWVSSHFFFFFAGKYLATST
jgi:hypothetical protein